MTGEGSEPPCWGVSGKSQDCQEAQGGTLTPAWEMLFFRLRDHRAGSAQKWEPNQTRGSPPPPPALTKRRTQEQSGGNPCSYRSSSDVDHKKAEGAGPSQRQGKPSRTGFNYFRVRSLCWVNTPDVYAFVYFDFLFVLLVVDDVVVLVKL